MDVVTRIAAACAAFLLFTACAAERNPDSVFRFQSDGCAGAVSQTRFIVGWEDGTFTVETAPDAETLKREFIAPNLDKIRFVEHDRLVHLSPSAPDIAAPASTNWGQDKVEAAFVWNQGVTGAGVVVGVVDSMVDLSHAQLSTRIAVNGGEIPGNGIDDDQNGYVDDVNGVSFISSGSNNPFTNPHGSHVTGIIVADHSRGAVKGLAPQAKFVPAPFITNDGWGNLGDAIQAMQYTASRGAKVINASWGGPTCLTAMYDAFAELGRQGVLVVVAAGNDGVDIDRSPTYPAAFGLGNQLTVGASTSTDFLAGFSNFGLRLVHLAAPGANIVSTVPGGVDTMSGTSMAAPFVAGTAALIWSARPAATATQVRQAILNSVTTRGLSVSTRGRLNVRRAYEELLRLAP